jgi:transposase InsO family protein
MKGPEALVTVAFCAAVLGITHRAMNKRLRNTPHQIEVGRGGPRKVYRVQDLPRAMQGPVLVALGKQQISSSAGVDSSPAPALAGGPVPVAAAAGFSSPAARIGREEGAKRALAERVTEAVGHARSEAGLRGVAALSGARRSRLDARLAILAAFDAHREALRLKVKPAAARFCERYAAGDIAVEAAARALYPSLSPSTLMAWRRALKNGGAERLMGQPNPRAGRSKVEEQPALREFVAAMLTAHPHASARHVQQAIHARFNGHSRLDYPSYSGLRRWIVGWKRDHAQVFCAVANPDAWKSNYMAAFGSASEGVTRLNQRWEFDSTPADVMLADGRHAVIGVIDVMSRRARLLVAKTSRAVAVATLTRHALLDWGVPETAKTDNGADYVSRHMTRVFMGLGIAQQLCPPFQPWEKPHIERFFRSFAHDLVELLPGFIGHNVAEREAIRSRSSFAERLMTRGETVEITMTGAEFQHFADRWCDDIYAHRAHDGLGGRSPFEITAAWREPVRRIQDPHCLDVLLAEAPGGDGLRRVRKKGIALDQTYFIAPELAIYIGQDVQVRYDPLDLGRIYVFAESGEFLCVAEAPARTGMDRQEVAAKARELQKARVQEERRALKAAAKRLGTDDIVQEILAERAQAAGKLAYLPAPVQPHATPALEEAARGWQSARSRDAVPVAQFTAEDQARLDDIAEEMARPRPVDVRSISDPRFLYAHWLRLDERARAGGALDEREREFHLSYAGSAGWRAQKRVFEDFGLTAADFQ